MKTLTVQCFFMVFANPKTNIYNEFDSMFCFLFSFCCILLLRLSFDFVFKFSVFGFLVFVLDALTHENTDSTMLFYGFCESKDEYLQQVRFDVLFSVFVLLYSFFV